MLLQFEKELSQAVEALTKEQQKAAQAENEKQKQVGWSQLTEESYRESFLGLCSPFWKRRFDQ